MDGVSRPSGAGVPFEFNGKTLIFEPLGLKDFGVIEQHLLSKQKNSLQILKEMLVEMADILTPEERAQLIADCRQDAKRENKISPQEVATWIDTVEGVCFTVWLSLRKSDPKLSLEEVTEIVLQMGDQAIEQIMKTRDQASGLDELGNSTGPAEETTTVDLEIAPKNGRSRTTGGSSATSRKPTTGRRPKRSGT